MKRTMVNAKSLQKMPNVKGKVTKLLLGVFSKPDADDCLPAGEGNLKRKGEEDGFSTDSEDFPPEGPPLVDKCVGLKVCGAQQAACKGCRG